MKDENGYLPKDLQVNELLKKVSPDKEIAYRMGNGEFASYAFVLMAVLQAMSPYLQIAIIELLKNRVTAQKDKEYIDGQLKNVELIFKSLHDWAEKNKGFQTKKP